MQGITPITDQVFGILGRMAPRDIVRSLSRTSVAIAALMVAVSVIVGVSIMIGSFRGTVIQWLIKRSKLRSLLRRLAQAPIVSLANSLLRSSTILNNGPNSMKWSPITMRMSPLPVLPSLTTSQKNPFSTMPKLISAEGDVSHGERPYAWKQTPGVDPWIELNKGEGVIISEALLLKENIDEPTDSYSLKYTRWRTIFSSDRGVL